jgi:Txe/YoeB family toxin of Txe-Axe toxin-antitoxin module
MLTLVHADCARCGATSETVQRDRELRPAADVVCCELDDLIRMDSREPYAEDAYYEPLEPELECFYCGERTRSPFRICGRAFCCKGCASDYGE